MHNGAFPLKTIYKASETWKMVMEGVNTACLSVRYPNLSDICPTSNVTSGSWGPRYRNDNLGSSRKKFSCLEQGYWSRWVCKRGSCVGEGIRPHDGGLTRITAKPGCLVGAATHTHTVEEDKWQMPGFGVGRYLDKRSSLMPLFLDPFPWPLC